MQWDLAWLAAVLGSAAFIAVGSGAGLGYATEPERWQGVLGTSRYLPSRAWNTTLGSVCPSLLSFPEFFDIGGYKCIRAFTVIDLDSCVMVMDYW